MAAKERNEEEEFIRKAGREEAEEEEVGIENCRMQNGNCGCD